MAANTQINKTTQQGGDTYRSVEKSEIKTQVVTLDLGGAGAESLVAGSLPVTGAFFQATQPVSAASLPLPTGAATEATVAGIRTDIGTDGATPPAVLGAGTGIRGWLRSIYEKLTGTLAVTGTFWQATQPISGTVTANAGTGTLAVSLATAPTTPVTGTFWQAAQPVTDNAGSLTVDAPVATPVFVRLSDGTAAIATLPVSIATNTPDVTDRAARLLGVVASITGALPTGANVIGALTANQSVNNAQIAGVATAVGSGVSGTGVQRVVLATDVIQPPVSESRAATLHVTATAAVNTAITCTLPAPGAGLFHYVTSVQLTKLYSVLGVAAGAGVVITSTNLPGTPAWLTPQAAGAIGTTIDAIDYQPTTPLKSAAANIATTFVAPAQLQTIWRWNVSYFTAA